MRILLSLFLACLLCLPGCASNKDPGVNTERIETTRNLIKKTVEDPAKAASMLTVLDAFEADLETHQSSIKHLRDRIVEDNRDYATSREHLEGLYGQLGEQVVLVGNTLRDRSFELRALCSAEEWEAIAPGKQALINFNF